MSGHPNLELSWFLDTLKTLTPNLKVLFWRVLLAGIILLVGIRIVRAVQGILKKTFERLNLEENVNRFLLSVINASMYAIVIFIAAEKLGVPSASIVALMGSAGVAIGLSLKEESSSCLHVLLSYKIILSVEMWKEAYIALVWFIRFL